MKKKFYGKKSKVVRNRIRRDRHTVSLISDHLVFSPKYRGKVLFGDVAKRAEDIFREICREHDIHIIEMAVNSDHVHLFINYTPKYSPSFIANMIKGKSSRRLRQEFPHLVNWCKKGLWARSCFHGSVGQGHDVVERYISSQK